MPTIQDHTAIQQAMCRGVVEGNKELIAALKGEADKRHDLRGKIDEHGNKVWELDTEVKLLKGILVGLVGSSADGTTGMVPRLEKDMRTLTVDVSSLRQDMAGMRLDLRALTEQSGKHRSFLDGWKGVGVALGIIGTCCTVVGGVVAGLVWLYSHGGVH